MSSQPSPSPSRQSPAADLTAALTRHQTAMRAAQAPARWSRHDYAVAIALLLVVLAIAAMVATPLLMPASGM